MYSEISPPEPPKQALVTMVESPYGFSLGDFGLSREDIAFFDEISISHASSGNWFGSLEDFKEGKTSFFQAIGEAKIDQIDKVAACIDEIAEQVLAAAGKKFGWFYLRASVPPDEVPLKRWHMDGPHYRTSELQYKFCITLQGDSTRFCLLPNRLKKLREVLWRNMNDVQFTNEFCGEREIFCPKQGEGVFFIIGRSASSALHSEPQVTRPRLFFSIVPCDRNQIHEMKNRIEMYYPPLEK